MQTVTPFNVENVTNYPVLITQFGCSQLDGEEGQKLFNRFAKITKREIPSNFRNFLISHREFNKILGK